MRQSPARSWDFLEEPGEQLRHAIVASLIALQPAGRVVDIGCGRGHLLRWLRRGAATGYVGVDSDAAQLADLSHPDFPVETIASTLQAFQPDGRDASALVFSEVLYYVDDPDRELTRVASRLSQLRCVIITMLVPQPDRPNWERSIGRAWASLGRLGWPERERIRVTSAAASRAWDIVLLDPGR